MRYGSSTHHEGTSCSPTRRLVAEQSRALSSVGRAPRLHRDGRGFESLSAHNRRSRDGLRAKGLERRSHACGAGVSVEPGPAALSESSSLVTAAESRATRKVIECCYRACGGIGIRVRLRSVWSNPWRFESSHAHNRKMLKKGTGRAQEEARLLSPRIREVCFVLIGNRCVP